MFSANRLVSEYPLSVCVQSRHLLSDSSPLPILTNDMLRRLLPVTSTSAGADDLPMRTNELALFTPLSAATSRPIRTYALFRPMRMKLSFLLSASSVSTGDSFFPIRMKELARLSGAAGLPIRTKALARFAPPGNPSSVSRSSSLCCRQASTQSASLIGHRSMHETGTGSCAARTRDGDTRMTTSDITATMRMRAAILESVLTSGTEKYNKIQSETVKQRQERLQQHLPDIKCISAPRSSDKKFSTTFCYYLNNTKCVFCFVTVPKSNTKPTCAPSAIRDL